MRRKLALMMAGMLSLSVLSACGGASAKKESAPAKEETITIWHSADAGIVDTMQKQVDQLASGVKVKFERKEQLSDALKLAGNDAQNAPDMYLWAHDKVGTFAQLDMLAPISELLSEQELKDEIPMTLQAGNYEGKNYQLPLYYESLMFLYNKDLMKEAPKTTDELLAKMKKETKPNQYVLVEEHSTAYHSANWIQGFGGYLLNKDRQPGLNLKETEEALAYHKQFVPYMPADGEYTTVTSLFTEGKSQAIIAGPWLIPSIKQANISLGIAPMPTLPNGNALRPYSGVQGVQVLKHAAKDKKEACQKVLKALADPKMGIALAESANCAPANQKAYEDKKVADNEMIGMLRSMSDRLIPMPNLPEMDVIWAEAANLLVDVNKKNADIKASCDKYQAEALEKIKAMK